MIASITEVGTLARARNTPVFDAVSSTPENLIVYALSSVPFVHLLPQSGLPDSLVGRIYTATSPRTGTLTDCPRPNRRTRAAVRKRI